MIIFIGLLVLYRRDPVPLNEAERRRAEGLEIHTGMKAKLKTFMKTYRTIFTDLNFVILLISFGLIHGYEKLFLKRHEMYLVHYLDSFFWLVKHLVVHLMEM